MKRLVFAATPLLIVGCGNPSEPSKAHSTEVSSRALFPVSSGTKKLHAIYDAATNTIRVQAADEMTCHSGYSVATGKNGELIIVCNDE